MSIILIASDHRGFKHKQYLIENFSQTKFIDLGTNNADVKVDYPDYAHNLCSKICNQEADLGILICGSGNGMVITANKYKKIRAAMCYNKEVSKLAKEHSNANVLVFGADFISPDEVCQCLMHFLTSKFEEGRHKERIDKITLLPDQR